MRRVLWGVAFAVCASDLIGKPVKITGISMQPSLNPSLEAQDASDVIFAVSTNIPGLRIDRGDVVVLEHPRELNKFLVKRILAREGDWVRVRGDTRFAYVPKGHCWVEGDNLMDSRDSNNFGPVPLALVTHKASFIVWPPNRIGFVSQAPPPHTKVVPGWR
eukprot:TRINITY_DN20142_c0_g1_i1.p1 TRINITY_DN20142_c0_g1~~TRINITY_DN20142_c0_g1_i1.p1  ORF type:complete len:161 (+),score=24.50 TRINITY_DN20142_c0_g1_i1:57-539(+)